jgi:hypothetical protein
VVPSEGSDGGNWQCCSRCDCDKSNGRATTDAVWVNARWTGFGGSVGSRPGRLVHVGTRAAGPVRPCASVGLGVASPLRSPCHADHRRFPKNAHSVSTQTAKQDESSTPSRGGDAPYAVVQLPEDLPSSFFSLTPRPMLSCLAFAR